MINKSRPALNSSCEQSTAYYTQFKVQLFLKLIFNKAFCGYLDLIFSYIYVKHIKQLERVW